MSIILHSDGLLGKITGTAYGVQVNPTRAISLSKHNVLLGTVSLNSSQPPGNKRFIELRLTMTEIASRRTAIVDSPLLSYAISNWKAFCGLYSELVFELADPVFPWSLGAISNALCGAGRARNVPLFITCCVKLFGCLINLFPPSLLRRKLLSKNFVRNPLISFPFSNVVRQTLVFGRQFTYLAGTFHERCVRVSQNGDARLGPIPSTFSD